MIEPDVAAGVNLVRPDRDDLLGRAPQRCWSGIMAATCGDRWARIARIDSSATGSTGAVSLASERPMRGPFTRRRAWRTSTGSNSCSTAQPNIPRTRLTSLLMSFRDCPATIIDWRTLAKATGPNSTAGAATG
jgi:hypothetical protein